MTQDADIWSVRLTSTAERDFHDIIDWTEEQFGDLQARAYSEVLLSALEALSDGPAAVGVRERPEISKGLFTLHVARNGRRGRHVVLFRVDAEQGRCSIEVLRLLHDAMDLPLHVSEAHKYRP